MKTITDETFKTLDPSRDDFAHADFFDASKTLALELEFCQDECDGDKRCAKSCVPSQKEVRGNGSRMRARIERQGPWKSAKALVTGFRKFGERYMSNCHGHRAGTHMNRFANEVFQFIDDSDERG